MASVMSQPGAIEVFKYHPLDPNKNEIRLLRILKPRPTAPANSPSPQPTPIQCEVFNADLDQAPVYNALSYTWGPPSSAATYSILLDGKSFLVRENLWMALERFQFVDNEMVIWIDAICINQESIPERNSQVPKMTQIYKQADQVLTWLGTNSEARAAFTFMREFGQPDVTEDWALEQLRRQTVQLQALSKLLQLEYWTRMWVLQELTVAKSTTLYCGDDSISGEAMIRVQKLLVRIRASGLTYNVLLQAMDNDMFSLDVIGDDGLLKIQEWNESATKRYLSFLECLLLHADRSATDPRDMIYGLANIANEKSKYQISVDYALSVPDLYTSFARTEIQESKTLLILTRARPLRNQQTIPSWVPDWSTIKSNHVFFQDARQPQFYFTAAGETEPDVSFDSTGTVMTTKAVVLGRIDVLGKPTNMTSDRDSKISALAFQDWWSMIDVQDSQQHEAFARTILGKKPDNVINASQLPDILGMFGDFITESYPGQKVDEVLQQYWDRFVAASMNRRVGLMGRSYDRKVKDLERDKQNLRSWRRIFAAYCWDRRFFYLDGTGRRMGLVPSEAKQGDVVCIPLGCPSPMVFREMSLGHWAVVGEAYVDGLMYGEAEGIRDSGSVKVEEFELH